MDHEKPTSGLPPARTTPECRRRIRLLWMGLVTYLLIWLTTLRIVAGAAGGLEQVPVTIVALSSLITFTILTTFVTALKRTYERRSQAKDAGVDPR